MVTIRSCVSRALIGLALIACNEHTRPTTEHGSKQPEATPPRTDMAPATCAQRVADFEGWGKQLIAEGDGVMQDVPLVEVKEKPSGWRSGAPQVVVGRQQIFLDGQFVGSSRALAEFGRMMKVQELYELLEAKSEATPGGKQTLTVDLMVAPDAPWVAVASVAFTAAYATSGKMRWLFETGGGLAPPKSTAATKASLSALWTRCPEAHQALQTATRDKELSAMAFAELFFETAGEPLRACRCRVDFAALEAAHWARLRPPSGKAIYVVTTQIADPNDQTTPLLEAKSEEPWRDTHRLILEASEVGAPVRFRTKRPLPPP